MSDKICQHLLKKICSLTDSDEGTTQSLLLCTGCCSFQQLYRRERTTWEMPCKRWQQEKGESGTSCPFGSRTGGSLLSPTVTVLGSLTRTGGPHSCLSWGASVLPFRVLEAAGSRVCVHLGTQLGAPAAAPVTASVGWVKRRTSSPSVCVPGGGICPVWGGGTALPPARLRAWPPPVAGVRNV